MQNEKMLVGYFFQCLACKASFIRTVPQDCAVTHRGEIFLKDTGGQATGQRSGASRPGPVADKREFVGPVRESTTHNTAQNEQISNGAGFVRCPCCLSKDVRLAEIGDKK
jgi:hypothetical protein